MASNSVDALNNVIEMLGNRRLGYLQAKEEIDNEAYQALFDDLAKQSQTFIQELNEHVINYDGTPADADGTVGGAVHRKWLDIKGALSSGGEASVLGECERGEKRAVDVYQNSLGMDIEPNVKDTLQRQMLTVERTQDSIDNLRDHELGVPIETDNH